MKILHLGLLALVCCGGGSKTGSGATTATTPDEPKATQEELNAAVKPCGEKDKVHHFDLHDEKADEALAPCAGGSGGHDYSGLIKMEAVENGVHITIEARDDEVTLLGADAKSRDAVIVYPKGPKGTPEGIEVPLMKTKTGYVGDKIIFWDQLDKLHDEGTQLQVAIFDHDKTSGTHEELHVAVNVSTGKSCEKAQDENPQEITMGKKGTRDLTAAELGRPMQSSAFIANCGLPDASDADICVAVKKGKPLGVSVKVTPSNNKIAACIDKATRRLSFPSSEKLDVVHQKF
jgi:hypothetical protein